MRELILPLQIVIRLPDGERHQPTKLPRGTLIKQVGEPEHRQQPAHCPAQTEEPMHAKCDGCGHALRLSASGKLWAHDVNGRVYRGLGGKFADRSRPCPGKPVVEIVSEPTAEELRPVDEEPEITESEA
jgi:hypothetical protein